VTGLSPDSVARRYEEDGYVSPLEVLDQGEVARFRHAYDDYEHAHAREIAELPARERYLYLAETHAYLPWVYELATHPNVLSMVERLLGPDLLIWDSRWFTKNPGDPTYVSWHQDGTYWALDPPKACTAWIALSRSYLGNGAMQVVPGSHRSGQFDHVDRFDPANALARGQEIAVEVDQAVAVALELEPGNMSLHRIGVIHGSRPNTSNEPRIGLAVRFIAPDVRQAAADPIGMLARGVDRHGNFDLLEPPSDSSTSAISARRAEIVRRFYGNVMQV
jgi:non-heme Fe2+,alpha-ketoglutarate-dependent halogenase